MKKLLLLLVLALAGVAAWYFLVTKPRPDVEGNAATKPASKHTPLFNQSVDSSLRAYYSLSEALVNWDSTRVDQHISQLQERMDHFPVSTTDSVPTATAALQTVQQQLDTLASARSLEQKRIVFNGLSQQLYQLLRTVQYDAAPVYLQECPMAFNDEQTGQWLSNTAAIRNPYLGLHHPRYKSGMLECGETKDSLHQTAF